MDAPIKQTCSWPCGHNPLAEIRIMGLFDLIPGMRGPFLAVGKTLEAIFGAPHGDIC